MKIYFTSRSIPELAALPAERRSRIWERCHPKAWRHWQTWVALFGLLVGYSGGFYLAVFAQPDTSFSWPLFCVGILLLAFASTGFSTIHATMTRPYIIDQLEA